MKINKVVFHSETAHVYFNTINEYFIVDLEDYPKIKDYCWWKEVHGGQPKTSLKSKKKLVTSVARIILEDNISEVIDHRDGNPLNNRKLNLRPCTMAQNNLNHKILSTNSSGTTGVCYKKDRGRWVARIEYNKKVHNLGNYSNKEDAIKARKEAEEKYFGEFSRNYKENIDVL